MNDRAKIRKAFDELRKLGWFARQSFCDCQTCGCAEVPESYNNKFVFYHQQDAEAINIDDGNICKDGMYLTHGEGGSGREIVKALKAHGLKASWNGNNDTRILVQHKD
jgi:hypothetical protein